MTEHGTKYSLSLLSHLHHVLRQIPCNVSAFFPWSSN